MLIEGLRRLMSLMMLWWMRWCWFVCRISDVSSTTKGDALVTGSVNYEILNVLDDGTGMTTLILEVD